MEKFVPWLITSWRNLYTEIIVLGELCSRRIFLGIKESVVNYELEKFVPGELPTWRFMLWVNYLLEKKLGRNESGRKIFGRKM